MVAGDRGMWEQGWETAMASRAAGQDSSLAVSLSPHAVCIGASCDSFPLGLQQVRLAQKMLCRRFFPRPGAWKARLR